MSTTFYTSGTPAQIELVNSALEACDFDFDLLKPSMMRESRTTIRVEWSDLSRYNHSPSAAHEHAEGAHTITREVDGRQRVLGLFYLPPHTRVLLDTSLEQHPDLAREVFLAEAAHAVDYHFMKPEHRRAVVNLLHRDDLAPDADVSDGAVFHLDGHECSWFDVGAYEDWVGEAFMETFIEAYARSVPVTIALNHPTTPTVATAVRMVLTGAELAPAVPVPDVVTQPASAPDPARDALVAALQRVIKAAWCPAYLRRAAKAWLDSLG
jgi:hypothetical protein